jgi:RimJ/RimL family protein N-acetyltransferase
MADVELRRASAADLGYLAELGSDPAVEPFLVPGSGSFEQLEALLRQTQADGDPAGLFVIQTAVGEPLGGLALTLVSRHSRICQLNRLMVAPAGRGRGVAAGAVRLACRHVLVEHDFHRVQVETYGDNVPAQRLFERVGFTYEGARRRAYWRRDQWLDGVLYGMLVDEVG